MNQIYYCPNCKNVYSSDGSANPTNACSCGGTLIGTGISADIWENLSDAEKNVYLAGLKGSPVSMQDSIQQIPQQTTEYYNMCQQFFFEVSRKMEEQKKYQERIDHDLHILYVIFMIGFIFSLGVGFLYLILMLT